QKVVAGQLLVKFDTSDLELSAVEARQSISQAQSQAADAMRRGNGAEQQQAEAKVMQGQARLDLLNNRIASAQIRAPIDGTIIAGDLTERVGARLKIGEPLFEIAPLDSMRLIAKVADSDIGLVIRAMQDEGMVGSVATKAYPDRRFPLTVERIVPMAQAKDGKNTFLVHASLDESAAWMRPGMEGLAKLEVGDRTLLWIGSRRIVDKLRLWLWW
ncbi:HlyD family efflux transporter periplasmic adaptor subunit, partial [Phycisphaeraceae bacterium AH-315-B13]|nr:HlyD family efflux transporter periplasmic adaptor subunit [Phycisphaeraceae bacterium AH-315-B13]